MSDELLYSSLILPTPHNSSLIVMKFHECGNGVQFIPSCYPKTPLGDVFLCAYNYSTGQVPKTRQHTLQESNYVKHLLLFVPVKKNEETVYAEVKRSEIAPSEISKSRKEGMCRLSTASRYTCKYTQRRQKNELGHMNWAKWETLHPPSADPMLSAESPEKPGPRFQRYWKVTMCLAVLCPFLLLGITALCACHFSAQCRLLSMYAGEQLRGSSAAKQQLQTINSNLTAENEDLAREIRELKSERDALNRKLEAILQFSNFPVNKYCTVKSSDSKERQCSLCPAGWRQYNSSCYYVYLGRTDWKSWTESRQECIKMGADLVTIDSEDEQRFISELAPNYYDKWHGYWIGLRTNSKGWVWVNGAPLTEGFWINEPNTDYEDQRALTNTKDNTLKSWRSVYNWQMQNRWICENKALIF